MPQRMAANSVPRLIYPPPTCSKNANTHESLLSRSRFFFHSPICASGIFLEMTSLLMSGKEREPRLCVCVRVCVGKCQFLARLCSPLSGRQNRGSSQACNGKLFKMNLFFLSCFCNQTPWGEPAGCTTMASARAQTCYGTLQIR